MTTKVIESRFEPALQRHGTSGAQNLKLVSAARVSVPPPVSRPAPQDPEVDHAWAERLQELLDPAATEYDGEPADPAAVERTDHLLNLLEAAGYPTEIVGIFAGDDGEVRFEFQDDVRFYAVSIPSEGPFRYNYVDIDGPGSARYNAASEWAIAGLLGLPFVP